MNLKRPIFGNVYLQDSQVEFTRSLDGEVTVVKDSNWPVIQSFRMQFRGLTYQQRKDLLDYFISVAGQEQVLTDHENVTWVGIFSSDPEIVQEGRNCMYQLSITFEGSPQ